MTDDELNALIEKELFGREWTKHPRVRINEWWREVETWLPADSAPWDAPSGAYPGQRPPNHVAVLRWFRQSPPPV